MNEAGARAALLVRAWETAPAGSVRWSDEDRAWASRTAARLEGAQAPADAFVARRARLALERIAEREPGAGRLMQALEWRPWAVWAAALAALLLGIAADAIGASQRINLLAPPLLALILWNLAIYAATAVRTFAGRVAAGPLNRLLARLTHASAAGRLPARFAPGTEAALARFAADWTRASARLNAARVGRLLHVAAIAFACGALAGLYLRGLAFEYRAGWESTFLDASSVRAILGFVLGPASALTGIGLPDATGLQAMRLPGPGAEAAPWIHLYAVTTALVIVLPRLALAIRDLVTERRVAEAFPLSLDEPYFASLARAHRGEAITVAAVPYNHRPSAEAGRALAALSARLFGPSARMDLREPVAYGDEDLGSHQAIAGSETPGSVLALLSATATPEAETHGAFLDALGRALPAGVPMVAIIDESSFVSRFGSDPLATRRREERREAWIRALAGSEHPAAFVDLERDDAASLDRAVGEALQGAARRPARTGAPE